MIIELGRMTEETKGANGNPLESGNRKTFG